MNLRSGLKLCNRLIFSLIFDINILSTYIYKTHLFFFFFQIYNSFIIIIHHGLT